MRVNALSQAKLKKICSHQEHITAVEEMEQKKEPERLMDNSFFSFFFAKHKAILTQKTGGNY